jgi:hypothetical protein
MQETMEFQTWKQRREELLREADRDRLIRTLRRSRQRRRVGRLSFLTLRSKKAQAARRVATLQRRRDALG